MAKVSILVSLYGDQINDVEAFVFPEDALQALLDNAGVTSVEEYEEQRSQRIDEGTEHEGEWQLLFNDIEVKPPTSPKGKPADGK